MGAAMLIQLSDPTRIPDLAYHFARSGFIIDDETAAGLTISGARGDEIRSHLASWRRRNPHIAALAIETVADPDTLPV
jgi:hypothetical protein